MPVRKRKPLAAMTERTEGRGRKSKIWNTSTPGRRILQVYMGDVHWDNNGVFDEIDFTPSLRNGTYSATNGPFEFDVVNSRGPGYGITGKRISGTVRVSYLNTTGGSPTVDATDPLRVKYLWADTLPGIDVEVQVRGAEVFSYTFIKSPTSAHTWEERVIATGEVGGTEFSPMLVNVFGDKLMDSMTIDTQGTTRTHTISKTTPLVLTPEQYPLVAY